MMLKLNEEIKFGEWYKFQMRETSKYKSFMGEIFSIKQNRVKFNCELDSSIKGKGEFDLTEFLDLIIEGDIYEIKNDNRS